MLHVKSGDTVLVLTGKDKNKTGKVISASPKDNTVIVEGVNIITKHRKPRNQQDKGGIEKVAGNIHASNVQIICPACGKATRIAHIVDENGVKNRVCKKCDAKIDSKFVKRTNKDKKQANTSVKKEEKATKSTTKKVVKSKKADKAEA